MITFTCHKKEKSKKDTVKKVEIKCFRDMNKAKEFAQPIAVAMQEAEKKEIPYEELNEYITDMSYDTPAEGMILAELGLIGQSEDPRDRTHAVHVL